MSSLLPLHYDQINSEDWIKMCDYCFVQNPEPFTDRMYFELNGKLRLFRDKHGIDKDKGVIFCGTTQHIKDCLAAIPETGRYILITRDIDQSVTEDLYRLKPKSIVHWFAINCAVKYDDITAIPYGSSPVGGMSKTLQIVCDEVPRTQEWYKLIYCRCNTPREMNPPHERHTCINNLKKNELATVIEHQVQAYDNFKYIRNHPLVAAPSGTGADTLRLSESIILGSVPIVNDCTELRHFEDLPLLFTTDWNFTLTELPQELFSKEWRENKTTKKLRMSHWQHEVLNKSILHGIKN